MRQNKLKTKYPNQDSFIREVATALNNEPTFTVTLSSSTSVTTVSNALVGTDSFIGLMPRTAAAAAELSSVYISTGKQTFTINHSSGSSTRSYVYYVFG